MRWATGILVCGAALALSGCGSSFLDGEPSVSPTAPAMAATSTTPDASAKPAEPEKPQGLALYDSNHDGLVQRVELEAGIAKQFKADDTDGSGEISPVELRVVNDRIMQEPDATPVIDWNADGKIVMQEYASQWRTMFDRADVNRDGTVDESELAGRSRERRARPLPSPDFGKYRGKI